MWQPILLFKVFDDLGNPKRQYSTTWEWDLTISCLPHCTFIVLIQIGQKLQLKNTKRKVQYVQTARFLNPVKHILRLEHSHRAWSFSSWCVWTQCCVLVLLPTRRASCFSCSPRVVTCFVAVCSLNWNFCHTADWKLDSLSAFLVLPESILSLTTIYTVLSSVGPGEGVIALKDARKEIFFFISLREAEIKLLLFFRCIAYVVLTNHLNDFVALIYLCVACPDKSWRQQCAWCFRPSIKVGSFKSWSQSKRFKGFSFLLSILAAFVTQFKK